MTPTFNGLVGTKINDTWVFKSNAAEKRSTIFASDSEAGEGPSGFTCWMKGCLWKGLTNRLLEEHVYSAHQEELQLVNSMQAIENVVIETVPSQETFSLPKNTDGDQFVEVSNGIVARIDDTNLTVAENTIITDLDNEEKEVRGLTPHTNPNWLSELKINFKNLIILKCSPHIVDLVNSKTNLTDKVERKRVSDEIINKTVGYLGNVFKSTSNTPQLQDLREIAVCLSRVYPPLFDDTWTEEGDLAKKNVVKYGEKPLVLDIHSLAKKLSARYRDRIAKPLKRSRVQDTDSLTDAVEGPNSKKGRGKNVYGVDKNRVLGKKLTPATVAAVNKTANESSFELREAVYEARRAELQYQFKNALSKNISNMARGFFKDPRHLENQFKYITNSSGIEETIRKQWNKQIEHYEIYLSYCSLEMKDEIEAAKTICEVDFGGCTVYKEIQIMVN